jgi:hypothetical protein
VNRSGVMFGRRWLIVAFAAGIAVGIGVERLRESSGGVSQPAAVAAVGNTTSALPPAAPVSPAAKPVPPAPRAPQSTSPSASPASASTAESAPAPPPTDYDGYQQPIDVGPAFRKEVAAQSLPGIENHLGDAHRALEREVRDDSWSYPLEAEIQNSLVADTSMGNFKLEHVECRATMCEIRLSAKGDAQSAALSKWSDNIQSLPWGARVLPISRSMVSTNGQVDELFILKKPPMPAPKN